MTNSPYIRSSVHRDDREDDQDSPDRSPTRSIPVIEPRSPSSSSLPTMAAHTNAPPATTPPPSMTTILPLLVCPQCNPPRPLVSPTTLHCGHTVCASHVEHQPDSFDSEATPNTPPLQSRRPLVPSCPLRSCHPNQRIPFPGPSEPGPHPEPGPSNSSSMLPTIPSTSRVVFLAPRHARDSPDLQSSRAVKVHHATTDVVLSKVLSLVQRYGMQFEPLVALAQDNDQPHGSTNSNNQENDQDRDDQSNSSEDEDGADAALGSSQAETGVTNGPRYRSPSTDPNSPSADDRARKRRRRQSPDNSPSAPPLPEDSFTKELLLELTCEICYMLIYKPVTTPCQHTFCAKCLQRSLDHSDKCPLCRQELPGYSYFHDHPVNKLILSLLLTAFPVLYNERGAQIANEDRDAKLNTPIFVCQLSFPGMPTLLHFFEPRYRLMLRRCLEQSVPCFGMIMPPQPGGATDYGTMLEIRSVQMLPDGRSMVETWGTRRFRILERGSFDGYMVGRIEAIEDFEDELEGEVEKAQNDRHSRDSSNQSEPTNAQLMEICHKFVNQLRSGMAPWVVQRLNHTYGPMPTDISNFTFWMGLVLPIDEHEKAKLLPIRSPRLRLRLLVHWIEQLNSQWWFMNGCTIV